MTDLHDIPNAQLRDGFCCKIEEVSMSFKFEEVVFRSFHHSINFSSLLIYDTVFGEILKEF